MNSILVVPFLVLFSLASCKREDPYGSRTTHDLLPPLVVRTALADTLPERAIRNLGLENVQGIKVKYATGRYTSYFDYEADRRILLDTIGTLPFYTNARVADTLCRRIPNESIELMKSFVSAEEQETGNMFWDADVDEFDVYECFKAPFKHTLLIARGTSRVIHRIEYTG
jgi:hypothetical protein